MWAISRFFFEISLCRLFGEETTIGTWIFAEFTPTTSTTTFRYVPSSKIICQTEKILTKNLPWKFELFGSLEQRPNLDMNSKPDRFLSVNLRYIRYLLDIYEIPIIQLEVWPVPESDFTIRSFPWIMGKRTLSWREKGSKYHNFSEKIYPFEPMGIDSSENLGW